MVCNQIVGASVFCLLFSAWLPASLAVAQANVEELDKELTQLSDIVVTASERQTLASQLSDHVQRSRKQLLQADFQAWSAISSREQWQRFRDDRISKLRHSLGQPLPPTDALKIEVRGRYEDPGQRFVIENIIYESRPHVWVTANLYRPAKMVTAAPGILISHAHHTPKEHAELQAMGMTWARAGCYVLVPDHFGHGERRQHPFDSSASFPGNFRVSRQDYYFRYDSGIKLHLLGESLMSWLAWDLSRAVDCLLQQPGIDKAKIIALGAVAGGGDPCAVAAALDQRIAAAVPFNFGGPQPETAYPLPADAQTSFNYAGSGSWESTRNLTNSTAAGFMPWLIVGSLAPRRLVYGHEFRWDQEHDPVWQRLQTIYQYYAQPENLAFTHGRGELRGQPPEATHCTHIGAEHRQRIHAAFRKWFQIDVAAEDEILEPLPMGTLQCFKGQAEHESRPTRVDFAAMAREPLTGVRTTLAQQSIVDRRRQLQTMWMKVLTPIEPQQIVSAISANHSSSAKVMNSRSVASSTLQAERVTLSSTEGLQIPVVLLCPARTDASKKYPVVMTVQTFGITQQLKKQSQELAQLLAGGKAVCLCDVRGAGEGRSGSSRGRNSAATSISSNLLMLGDPQLAGQLRDLRGVWSWLRARPEIDSERMHVWGDSRWPTVTAGADRVVPRDDDASVPPAAEPAACLLALLLSLYEDSMQSLHLSGGMNSFSSALEPMQVRVPHDCVVPGMFRAGDIEELIAQAAERLPVRCEAFVDGHNRPMSQAALAQYEAQLKRLLPSGNQLNLTFSQ